MSHLVRGNIIEENQVYPDSPFDDRSTSSADVTFSESGKQAPIDLDSVRYRGSLISGTSVAADGSMAVMSGVTSSSVHVTSDHATRGGGGGSSGRDSGAGFESVVDSHAPDSDFADVELAPQTIWHQRGGVGSVVAGGAEIDNIFSRGGPEYDAADKALHRRPSRLWIGLGITSLLLIGAVIAVSIVVFGGGGGGGAGNVSQNGGPNEQLNSRQQLMNKVIGSISDESLLGVSTTPQYQARQWMLFNDTWSLQAAKDPSTSEIAQRYVLAVFYYSTNGPTWRKANIWLQGDECNQQKAWDGVNCNSNSQVRTIALENNGLQGSIPPEIGHLSMLQNVVLKNQAGLIGSIPSTIGKLTGLQQLGLYYCTLTGPIPDQLFMVSSLQYINLQNNGLTGTISPMISNLNQLQTLVLMNNGLGGNIPFDKLSVTNVEFVALSNNTFTGQVSDVLGMYPRLKYLYLDHNKLSGVIPPGIGLASRLKSLNLDYNSIGGPLPTNLGNLKKLEYFSIQSNNLGGPLPTQIGVMSSLNTINLSKNRLSGPLPDMSKLTNLANLLLARNQFTGSIATSLINLKALEKLLLSSNGFTGTIPDINNPGATKIPLKGLYLSENKLTGTIPATICSLGNVEALFLDENSLKGTIPFCMDIMSSLSELYLFNNSFTGNLPSGLSTLRNLSAIGVEINNLAGTVPDAVCASVIAKKGQFEFWSDCGGTTPKVTCPCCTVCCPSGDCV